jgi:excisionase family DNA binding protein
MRKRQDTLRATSLDPSQLQLLAVPEVAKLLSVGRTTVYALIAARELDTVKIGSSRRVLLCSLFRYIERQRRLG